MPPLDKQSHFWAGAAIGSTMVAYGFDPLISFVVASAIGALKEVWDKVSGTGTPDKWDFVATVVGAAIVLPIKTL